MNYSDLWDWRFMWQMSRNFMASVAPFVMIIVAVAVAGMILTVVVGLVIKMRAK